MNDRNLVRGLFLMAIALAFGITALQYPSGSFSRPGPGMFPLMVSSLLLLIGIATVVRSRYVERVHLQLQYKNIGLILGSLCAFAIVSEYVNMILGIIVMVFLASFAASSYSIWRNVKIAAGLIAMAFVLQKFLGLNLPLY